MFINIRPVESWLWHVAVVSGLIWVNCAEKSG